MVSPPAPAAPSDAAVSDALRGVIDPELGDDIVSLGMVAGWGALPDGRFEVRVSLTTAGCPLRAQLMHDVAARVGAIPGLAPERIKVTFGEMSTEQKRRLMDRARHTAQQRDAIDVDIPRAARVVAIASGKGGVGKSSVTANLAVALASRGLTVGVLDADIGGYSIPRMLGISARVEAEKGGDGRPVIRPIEKEVGAGRLRVVSMGSIEGAEEDEAIMLRGLMLNRAVQHFLEDVSWGSVDYLLIDMPPGTSDIQMGLARMVPRAEVLIITTPALAAQKVAARAADMARKGHLRVAGVIENMSAFVCDHGVAYPLFGTGGGVRLAEQIGVPLLGSIPLDPGVASGGDAGEPAALGAPSDSEVAAAFHHLADKVATEALPVVDVTGCTAVDALQALG